MAHRKYTYCDFSQEQPNTLFETGAITVGAGTDNTTSHWRTSRGAYFEVRNEQTNADIQFTKDAQGWVIPCDNADNDGIEITQGIQATTTPMSFTIGTSPAFFIDCIFDIPDVSDYDVAYVGFRTLAAYADALNSPANLLAGYTNMMGLNVNAGNIDAIIATSDASVADTATDTTANWADTEQNRLRINVSGAGVVTYQYAVGGVSALYSGSTLTTWGTTYTAVTGQVVVPSLIFVKGAAAADTPPILVKYRCGLA